MFSAIDPRLFSVVLIFNEFGRQPPPSSEISPIELLLVKEPRKSHATLEKQEDSRRISGSKFKDTVSVQPPQLTSMPLLMIYPVGSSIVSQGSRKQKGVEQHQSAKLTNAEDSSSNTLLDSHKTSSSFLKENDKSITGFLEKQAPLLGTYIRDKSFSEFGPVVHFVNLREFSQKPFLHKIAKFNPGSFEHFSKNSLNNWGYQTKNKQPEDTGTEVSPVSLLRNTILLMKKTPLVRFVAQLLTMSRKNNDPLHGKQLLIRSVSQNLPVWKTIETLPVVYMDSSHFSPRPQEKRAAFHHRLNQSPSKQESSKDTALNHEAAILAHPEFNAKQGEPRNTGAQKPSLPGNDPGSGLNAQAAIHALISTETFAEKTAHAIKLSNQTEAGLSSSNIVKNAQSSANMQKMNHAFSTVKSTVQGTELDPSQGKGGAYKADHEHRANGNVQKSDQALSKNAAGSEDPRMQQGSSQPAAKAGSDDVCSSRQSGDNEHDREPKAKSASDDKGVNFPSNQSALSKTFMHEQAANNDHKNYQSLANGALDLSEKQSPSPTNEVRDAKKNLDDTGFDNQNHRSIREIPQQKCEPTTDPLYKDQGISHYNLQPLFQEKTGDLESQHKMFRGDWHFVSEKIPLAAYRNLEAYKAEHRNELYAIADPEQALYRHQKNSSGYYIKHNDEYYGARCNQDGSLSLLHDETGKLGPNIEYHHQTWYFIPESDPSFFESMTASNSAPEQRPR